MLRISLNSWWNTPPSFLSTSSCRRTLASCFVTDTRLTCLPTCLKFLQLLLLPAAITCANLMLGFEPKRARSSSISSARLSFLRGCFIPSEVQHAAIAGEAPFSRPNAMCHGAASHSLRPPPHHHAPLQFGCWQKQTKFNTY